MTWGPKRIIALILCLFALPLAAGCSATNERPVSASTGPHAGPALWKVADKDTTIYLFGTIHFLPDNVEWYADDISAALQSSGELVTEFDASEANRLVDLMQKTAFLPESENLRDKLSREDRLAFEKLLVTLGIPIERYDRYRPWAAGLEMSVLMIRLAGFDPGEGVEKVVLEKAPAGIKLSALETIDYQMGIFSKLPDHAQLAYFNQVIGASSQLGPTLDHMLELWLDGDAAMLARLMNSSQTDPLLYKRLLTDRNDNWARWIGNRLKEPGTVFVAVGAGHLAGKGSVQDRLKKMGIRARRVR